MVQIKKLLIANRGEIAIRIAKTCRVMGIRSVAVYSAADAGTLHVKQADEAFEIGPAPSRESYLCIPAILDAASKSRADAIHPGYGFLAENPDFARAVSSAGLVWVGPPAEVIALMGDKIESKSMAESVGVPVVPGYDGREHSFERCRSEADRIGYPVMIKAAAGGGGRGMRQVERFEELEPALDGARREAEAAFGDSTVFLEKILPDARHIEIQVLADQQGSAVHLGERDCSLQRRHQKIIEESPSPVLTVDLRAAMGEDALRLVRASGYLGAGTVEFLFSDDHYYFLEMNARIQVEHPVTEAVTGLDLVRAQIDVAQGAPLAIGQMDVTMTGHTAEARIYAEDPETGFLPSTGRLTTFELPQGPGVRNDVGVSAGSEVTSYYDPLLAKLIVHAPTREDTFAQMNQSLSDYRVSGVTTNLEFLRWLVSREEVAGARANVNFVDRNWTGTAIAETPFEVLIVAGAYELSATDGRLEGTRQTEASPWRVENGWRQIGLPRHFTYLVDGREQSLQASYEANGNWRMESDHSDPVSVQVAGYRGGSIEVQFDSRIVSSQVQRRGEVLVVDYEGRPYYLERARAETGSRTEVAGSTSSNDFSTPMPGTVVKVAVRVGQQVAPRDALIVLEAMKMEHVIAATHQGVVRKIFFAEGDLVPAGAVVVSLEAT